MWRWSLLLSSYSTISINGTRRISRTRTEVRRRKMSGKCCLLITLSVSDIWYKCNTQLCVRHITYRDSPTKLWRGHENAKIVFKGTLWFSQNVRDIYKYMICDIYISWSQIIIIFICILIYYIPPHSLWSIRYFHCYSGFAWRSKPRMMYNIYYSLFNPSMNRSYSICSLL